MFEPFKKYFENKLNISDRQWAEVEKYLVYKSVKHGDKLLEPGQTINTGFFVMKGCLRNYIVKNDKEFILQFAPDNWWIGVNYAVENPQPSYVNIDAVEDSRLVLFTHEFVRAFLLVVPEYMELRQELQQNQFRNLEKRILLLLNSSANERYIYFLNTYPNLAIRLPQKLIASYLGMTPQSLSRVRARIYANNR